ncbi:hypothetical protein H257_03184 [Aphanomyces astaci]|uniref:Uncharacterized protein n=1 Tax=Aphanomyces astaci TaxID=112090 RepID=W4H2R2_APHAT|nr:hypothetical protein H257_03184 [Aphanomyces astaci]ETV85448.1 hypothetical protein H257_03184 [Aphanomyces astaci]RQM22728.1 hypothetical protein B5M09_005183 [Aphanomyces astaci]|eukprot:XP_009825466.1 hypothetical protein H257_03184 [Aphanomyces astaci]
MRQEVFAQLPSYNPFVGSFHHAPSAGNRGAAYFAGDIVFTPELEMRKKLRQNPFAGTFHALPGYYDPLHGLKNFRKPQKQTTEDMYVEVDLDSRHSESSVYILTKPKPTLQRVRSRSESDLTAAVMTQQLKPKTTVNRSSTARRSSTTDVVKIKRQRSKSHQQRFISLATAA